MHVDGIIINGDPSTILGFRTDPKVETSVTGRNAIPGIN